MKRVRVKICGVMSPEIVRAAADAGADAVGLIFAESRRRVTVAQAAQIVDALPPFIWAVGVFVDALPDEVISLAHGVPLDAVQLHGEEAPEEIEVLRAQGVRVIKAVSVGEDLDAARLERYRAASAMMLDTRANGLAGGTGRAFDWHLARGLSDRFSLMLSGGLTAGNVEQALDIVQPLGVDVSSGVETDGRKDPQKIREFVEQVRRWESAQ